MMPALALAAHLPAMLVGVVPTVLEVLAVPLMRMASMVVVVVAGKRGIIVDIGTESCWPSNVAILWSLFLCVCSYRTHLCHTECFGVETWRRALPVKEICGSIMKQFLG